LNAYPKTSYKNKRRKVSIELKYALNKDLEENLKYVNKWHLYIEELIRKSDELEEKSSLKKPYLVIINPKSGSGQASKIFLQNVIKIWTEAKTYNKIIVTEFENFAYEYVKTLKLDDYRGIIVVSGDGVVHQVFNGLISRNDWKTAIKTPVGQIPAGSANGLSSSIAFLNDEHIKDVSLDAFASMMAFRMLKSRPKPIDIIKLQLENGSILHSFLNVEWAIVADVDSESESYRFLGGLRFIIGALLRILSKINTN
jgi:diacylglycerol kinase family enzyme